MNIFTTPSGHRSIDLKRIVCIDNRLTKSDDGHIIVMIDVPDQAGGMCELKYWFEDAKAILEAYQNQKETD